MAALAALLLAAAATPAAAAAPTHPAEVQTDAGIELTVTSAGPAVLRTCYPAGGLPAFVNGTYLVGGPARFEIGSYSFQAIFDGFGMMNRFELSVGQVCYTSVWLNTGYLRDALQGGQPSPGLYFEDTRPQRPSCPLLDPICNVNGPNDNNWVNIIPVGGEVLLLSDTPTMVRMDLETLNCSGRKPWADDKSEPVGPPQPDWLEGMHAGTSGSAHPLKIPGTDTWVEVIGELPEVMGNPWIAVYTFQGSVVGPQKRKKIGGIRTGTARYTHSFGVTPNYVVLPFNLELSVSPFTSKTLLDSFRGDWKGLHVMDLRDGSVQVFDTEPFFHVHTVNTFENASGIVMDLGFYKGLPFARGPQLDIGLLLNKTARDADPLRAGVRRLHLHLSGPAKGTTTVEDLISPGRSLDFFNINPARRGLPHCIYYAKEWWHDDVNYASMAILKHDVCQGTKKYWNRVDTYPGEPLFIEGGPEGAEDSGVVVFAALDGRARRSLFVVLDARTLEQLAAVRLPGHIPFTAHGNFIPAGVVGSAANAQAVVV